MGNRFLRLAVIYVLLGVTLGIVMAASHNFTFRPVHAHLNLLGWASMALFGLWYRSAPAAAETRLAKCISGCTTSPCPSRWSPCPCTSAATMRWSRCSRWRRW